MKNPNGLFNRMRRKLLSRWSAEDFPGSQARFQITLFTKDFAIFFLLPIIAIVLFKSCEVAFSSPKSNARARVDANSNKFEESKSQIIDFRVQGRSLPYAGVMKKAPGSLVRVRLLNVVETYANATVHAQIVDAGLGRNLVGSTLIGDATSDTNFNRIEITFRYVRDARRSDVAIPISARALSLDGTQGIAARKKEGFFARAALNSSGSAAQDVQGKIEGSDLKHILAKALASGLMQEFGSDSQVEQRRSQVLTLSPSTEFFVELTDYFPGNQK